MKSTETNIEKISITTTMDGPKRFGFMLFGVVFGFFGLWATLAPIEGAAFAPGTVVVRSYKKVVQHLEGGIVSQLLVEDGDSVEMGEPLLVLDATQPNSSLEIVRSQYLALKVRESRLIAERDNLDDVDYPSNLGLEDLDLAEEIAAQNEVFWARKRAKEGRIEILDQRIQQLNTQASGMQALKEAKEMLANSFAEEVADTQKLLDQGFSEKTRLREVERNYATFFGEAAELTANIATTQVQIGETELQILQERSEFRNNVVAELSDVQVNIRDSLERLKALRDVVDRTVVVAPDAGVVNGMKVHTVGGVIGPGSPIAEIVPKSDELIIEAGVNPTDIDRVSVGQKSRVRFSTFGSRAPTIEGTLLSLSADAVPNETIGGSYYLARIEVDPDSLNQLGDMDLIPGMPAEVFINTGSRTFLQYLFKPLSNAAARSFNED